MMTVNVITLGCSKNLVDSQSVLKQLRAAGFDAHHEWHKAADIVVVNTCGFIGDAKEESVNTILEQIALKNSGKIKELIVMGCLSERYRDDLKAELPEVDMLYGKFDWKTLVDDLKKRHTAQLANQPNKPQADIPHGVSAYIKIAEGCNRFCAFCAIPLITGRYKSRPIENIVAEVEDLVQKGVKEFNIIAQDLSAYGHDIYGHLALPQLIDRLASINGVKWIRLHYAYPAQFPLEVLDVMARHKNVCSYIDIALQHISDRVLTNMRRHITADETRLLLATMRKKVPGLHIRTTLMVGFPGEEDEDFRQLLEFVKEQRFERMGAFAYCEEEGTFGANNFVDSIPPEIKQQRLDTLMALQESISLEIQQQKIGKTIEVLVEREEPEFYVGRSQWDSPEVDPEVLISKDKKLRCGDFINVQITDALPYELIAKPI